MLPCKQTASTLRTLRPAVDEAGLDVKITCCDLAGWEDGRKILKGIQETGGEKYLDVVSGHGYGQPLSEPYDTPLEVWQGEWAELSSYFDQPWDSAEGDPKGTYEGGEGIGWANRILHSFTVSNISASSQLDGSSAIRNSAATPVIRTSNDTNILSERCWAYAALGRHARQDSSRVTATSLTENVTVAAWTPQAAKFPAGGNLAMQIVNNADEEKTVPVNIDKLAEITNSTTLLLNNHFNLAESDSVVEIDGTTITTTIPPGHSWCSPWMLFGRMT